MHVAASRRRGLAGEVLLALSALAHLTGCMTAPTPSPVAAPAASPGSQRLPSPYPVTALVGNWGVASYREDRDRQRTEAMARQHCRTPYVITRGPTDGVIMHVADDARPYELTFKGGADGKTYLGFDAPPGHVQDREIVSFSENLIVMRFVDPAVHARYGTFIYVRCQAAPTTRASR